MRVSELVNDLIRDRAAGVQKSSNALGAIGRIIKAKSAGQKANVIDEERDRRIEPQPILQGPGTELKKLIAKFGLHPARGCKCTSHMLVMNQKGCDWCSENIHTIVGWLKEEADRAKLPFTDVGAKLLVKRAISNARKAASK